EVKLVSFGQLVPQLLQANGRVDFFLCPKQSHHLAEGYYTRTAAVGSAAGSLDGAANDLEEQFSIRVAIYGDSRQGLGGVEANVSPLAQRRRKVETVPTKVFGKLLQVSRSCDHDGRIPGSKRGSDEAAQIVEQSRIFGVKLDDMS